MGKIKNTKLFIFDMDGTIYLGDNLIDGVLDFIKKLDEKGKDYIFLTNNSSKNSKDYQKKLNKLGIEVTKDKIVNAGEVTAAYLKKIKGKDENNVYVVGTPSLERVFQDYGFKVIKNREADINSLVVGFDTTLTYQKLWDAHYLINKGVKYYATNPDKVCPLPEGKSMPDCGSIINLLKTSTGQKPIVVGKPSKLMVNYISNKYNIDKKYISMVGDRLYTDIKMAKQSGINSILVLTGETKQTDLKNSQINPDYILDSVVKITEML
ncbi:MAG TPA: HAD-IIA family hydrolase [Halanaerobiales bacterium]|nr:HAD-IIA family hydrolase [Halanaerobiales bacterium]